MTPTLRPSVSFYTLGCKLNFSDTSMLSKTLGESGYDVVDFEAGAEIVVVNTCSVTDHADRKTKKLVREAKALNADAKVVIVGCYAQLKPAEILAIPGVDMVLGAKEKFNLVQHLGDLLQGTGATLLNSPIKEANTFYPSYSSGERTRSFLKVQDGCNYFCAFCTIPLARGFSRSGSIQQILDQVTEIAEQGYKEIVLTGVNIGDFKNGAGEDLLQLIQALEAQGHPSIERYRISSIEPNLLSPSIIEFVAQSQKFVPHFHIPLQSGSDTLLTSMRRRYHAGLYQERVALIKKLMPHACIGVDVIVGFPGETDALFEETKTFISNLPVSYLHVFTYSERPNTTAIRLPNAVLLRTRQERNTQLTSLSHRLRHQFYTQHLGTARPVLWEQQEKDGWMYGFTDNYIKVKAPYNANWVNQSMMMMLKVVQEVAVLGEPLASEPA